MSGFWAFLWGILGGVVGAFLKLWVDDLWTMQKERLTAREKELLKLMKQENGQAHFVASPCKAPSFQSRYIDMDDSKQNFCFEDYGEVTRLIKLGYIAEITRSPDNKAANYGLTGTGWKKVNTM